MPARDEPPPKPGSGRVTELLEQVAAGNRTVVDQLTSLLYDELYRLAAAHLRGERGGHTLQATALVNEAYLRLIDQERVQWRNRAHFLAVAARTMRRVLVDHARKRRASKRGGARTRVALEDVVSPGSEPVEVMALERALRKLGQLDPRLAQVVELRFFGGLQVKEAAAVLGISTATIKRDWKLARSWLLSELHSD